MKLFIVVERAYEYNDEYYTTPNCSGDVGEPVKAYKSKVNADAACVEMNAARVKTHSGMHDDNDRPITDFFLVTEVEVEDADVQSYASAQERIKAAKDEAVALAKKMFADESVNLFAAHPTLKSFGWCQYTPYFNDGDAVVFGVRSDRPYINGVSGDDLDSGIEYGPAPNYKKKRARSPSPEYEMIEPVTTFLGIYAADDMNAMFGDHVQVTVHRDGRVETDEYSHD